MKGKERDLKLASEMRETFIKRYKSNIKEFKELLDDLGDNCLEKLIHRFKGEYEINLYRDYNALKKIAAEVKGNKELEIFQLICDQDEARAWINDNGKYRGLAFEALYDVFKRDEKLKEFINSKDEKEININTKEEKSQTENIQIQDENVDAQDRKKQEAKEEAKEEKREIKEEAIGEIEEIKQEDK